MASGAVERSAGAAKDHFIIVTPRALSGALDEYITHKQESFDVERVMLEDVLAAAPGADDPEKLKHFLYDAWKSRSARYVLLVGDADVLPVRYMVLDRVTPPAFDYAFYPSDLYYADVAKQDGSFEDWNGAKDEFHARYFGEVRGEKNKNDAMNYDGIDYKPELAVGRWPVSTVEQTKIVADKTIAYDASRSAEAGPEPNRDASAAAHTAAFVCIGGWVDARGTLDTMAGQLPKSWTIERRYFADANKSFATPVPDEAAMTALFNAGTGLIIHAGHCSDDTWHGCFSTGTLKGVHNASKLPVVMSCGCSTARFATLPPYEAYEDADGHEHAGTNAGEVFTAPPPPPACYARGQYNMTGLGEQLIRGGPDGAVAYIGCNTGSQPCGLVLAEGFVRSVATRASPRVGDCWADAVSYYFDHEGLATLKPSEDWYPASIFFQGMKFMLFGDPTARVGK